MVALTASAPGRARRRLADPQAAMTQDTLAG
jgi:hypothetical protein